MGLKLTVRSGWASESSPAIYEFDQTRIVIGRRRGCDVQLPHAAVSGHHATILSTGNGYAIVDEGSTNGTRVGDARVPKGRRKPLRSGDRIGIGGFVVEAHLQAVSGSTSAEGTAAMALRMLRDARREEPLGGPCLTLLNGPSAGRSIAVLGAPSSLVLGRDESCDVTLDDADASREHAEVVHDLGGVEVRDLKSKNGIAVNGRRVEHKRLQDRDEVRVGSTLFVFEDPASAALEALLAVEDEAVEVLPVAPSAPPALADLPPPAADQTPITPAPQVASPVVLDDARPASHAPRADLFIYALAGTVLAISIAGLIWLLQAG